MDGAVHGVLCRDDLQAVVCDAFLRPTVVSSDSSTMVQVTEPYDLPMLSYSVLGGMSKIIAGLVTYPYQVGGKDYWLCSCDCVTARAWLNNFLTSA